MKNYIYTVQDCYSGEAIAYSNKREAYEQAFNLLLSLCSYEEILEQFTDDVQVREVELNPTDVIMFPPVGVLDEDVE